MAYEAVKELAVMPTVRVDTPLILSAIQPVASISSHSGTH